MPLLTVIAGPNGSGKSSLKDMLVRQGVNFGTYINADEIAKNLGLTGDAGAREAQKLADAAREHSLHNGEDFSFETVMSHQSKVQFMQLARQRGYEVCLYFVATADPSINVGRVEARVRLGGHDVPHDRIVARYYRTLELLPDAIRASSLSVIFDNSSAGDAATAGIRPVAEIVALDGQETFRVTFRPPLPLWVAGSMSLFPASG